MTNPLDKRFARTLTSMFARQIPARSKRLRLDLRSLEERIVPAFNITIDGDLATTITADTSTPGLVKYVATASNQNVDVDDIYAALASGKNVLIDTNSVLGGDPGDVTWEHDTFADDLYHEGALQSLTINTNGGTFTATEVLVDANDNLDVKVSTVSGAINITNTGSYTGFRGAHRIELDAGATGVVTLDTDDYYALEADSGDVMITGNTVTTTTGTSIVVGNDVIINAKVDPGAAQISFEANRDIQLNRTVDGLGTLSFDAGRDVLFNAAVGATTPVTELNFSSGTVKTGANNVAAVAVDVFGATFVGGSGTVAATNFNFQFGLLAPGGIGTVGTLKIDGVVNLNGGHMPIDFSGATGDLLDVTGTVNLGGIDLGGVYGTGSLTGAGPVDVLKYTVGLNGAFSNAPDGTAKVVTGGDVVTVDYFSAPDVIKLLPVAATGNTFTGVDEDGTQFTVKLTGTGTMVAGFDANAGRFVVVRGSGLTSQLRLTTVANASNSLVDFEFIAVDGPLAGFNGPTADVANFVVSRAAKTITLHELTGEGMILGGTAADKTTITAADIEADIETKSTLLRITSADSLGDVRAAAIGNLKARDVFGWIETTGKIDSVTVGDEFEGNVRAEKVGSFKVGGRLANGTWNVTGSIASITAGEIGNVAITARNIGSISATGSNGTSGDIDDALFLMTGNDGTAMQYGLKTISATGSIDDDCQFIIQNGGIDKVTVGRFLDETEFTVAKGIKSITAAAIEDVTVTARNLGTISATGKDSFIDGYIFGSYFTLTGNDGSARQYGLKSMTAKHEIYSVYVDVQNGGVDKVAAGAEMQYVAVNASKGINSISAATMYSVDVAARNLGKLSSTGSPEYSGDIIACSFTLTGNDGTAGKYGLKTVTAQGNINNVTFDVKAGNVDSVTVGRFTDSRFYVGYTPGATFDVGGSFTGAFKLNKFTTTATTIGDPNNYYNWSFKDSEIAADTLGTIKLSGVQTENGTQAFGIKFRNTATLITVTSSDNNNSIAGTVTASANPILNEFYVLDLVP